MLQENQMASGVPVTNSSTSVPEVVMTSNQPGIQITGEAQTGPQLGKRARETSEERAENEKEVEEFIRQEAINLK
jgi:hypothetical protein